MAIAAGATAAWTAVGLVLGLDEGTPSAATSSVSFGTIGGAFAITGTTVGFLLSHAARLSTKR